MSDAELQSQADGGGGRLAVGLGAGRVQGLSMRRHIIILHRRAFVVVAATNPNAPPP